MRGEHRQARAEAEAFVHEAEAEQRPMEAGVARRVLGFVSLLLGDLQEARKALDRALDEYVHDRDRDALFRFGNDTRVSASNFLALTEWHLGEFERARRLIDESARGANELGHPASVASALFFKTVIESRRGDDRAAQVAVESLRALTHEHNLKTYADLGEVHANWSHGKDSDPEAGAIGLSADGSEKKPRAASVGGRLRAGQRGAPSVGGKAGAPDHSNATGAGLFPVKQKRPSRPDGLQKQKAPPRIGGSRAWQSWARLGLGKRRIRSSNAPHAWLVR